MGLQARKREVPRERRTKNKMRRDDWIAGTVGGLIAGAVAAVVLLVERTARRIGRWLTRPKVLGASLRAKTRRNSAAQRSTVSTNLRPSPRVE